MALDAPIQLQIILDLAIAASFLMIHIWMTFTGLRWAIDRSIDERFRALPFSIFNRLFKRLSKKSKNLITNLIHQWVPIDQLYEALEPERITEQSVDALSDYVPALVDDLMRAQNPTLWDNLPRLVRNRYYRKTQQMLEPMVDQLVDQLGGAFEPLLDYENLISEALNRNPALIANLTCVSLTFFWQSLRERTLVFGLILHTVYAVMSAQAWVPAFSSNWAIASLLLCLVPLLAISLAYFSCGPASIKATPTAADTEYTKSSTLVFPKQTSMLWFQQQQYFNLFMANQLPNHVFYLPTMMQHIFERPDNQQKIKQIIERSLKPVTDANMLRTLTQALMGPGSIVAIKSKAVDLVLSIIDIPFNHASFVQKETQHISQFLSAALNKIPLRNLCRLLTPLTLEIFSWLLLSCLLSGINLSLVYAFI